MTECNGCGDCCQPVILTRAAIDLAQNPRISPRERKWLLDDLRPMNRKLAAQRSPWAFGGNIMWADSSGRLSVPAFYSCRHFNEETRSCMSHDDLPETCAGYPWFDQEPSPHRVLSPHCSYNVDVGRPVEITQKPRSTSVQQTD